MITLNLLDPQLKIEHRRRRWLLTGQNGLIVLFGLIALLSLIFYLAADYLQSAAAPLTAPTDQLGQEIDLLNQEIRDFNSRLNQIDQLQKNYLAWSPRLWQLTEAVPANVTLNYLKIDQPAKTLRLKGVAAQRDDLLLLENNLRGLAWITAVDSPLNNLVKQEKIDFELILTLGSTN